MKLHAITLTPIELKSDKKSESAVRADLDEKRQKLERVKMFDKNLREFNRKNMPVLFRSPSTGQSTGIYVTSHVQQQQQQHENDEEEEPQRDISPEKAPIGARSNASRPPMMFADRALELKKHEEKQKRIQSFMQNFQVLISPQKNTHHTNTTTTHT